MAPVLAWRAPVLRDHYLPISVGNARSFGSFFLPQRTTPRQPGRGIGLTGSSRMRRRIWSVQCASRDLPKHLDRYSAAIRVAEFSRLAPMAQDVLWLVGRRYF